MREIVAGASTLDALDSKTALKLKARTVKRPNQWISTMILLIEFGTCAQHPTGDVSMSLSKWRRSRKEDELPIKAPRYFYSLPESCSTASW